MKKKQLNLENLRIKVVGKKGASAGGKLTGGGRTKTKKEGSK